MTLTLADLTEAERAEIRIAFHEAGHATAAVLFGGVVHTAVVASGRVAGVNGWTTYDHRPEAHATAITFAGPWAEARWTAGRRPSTRDLLAALSANGHHDHKALRAAGGGLTDINPEVPGLLERTWPALRRVASKLFARGEVTHDDVLAALAITDGGGATSFQLANLRAGLSTVPVLL